jgi:carbamoyltransferase
LKDGKIVVAIETERLTRVKHDGGDDNPAIWYCLNAEGITIKDVDLVVQNANFDMFDRGNSPWGRFRIVDEARHVVSISHHLAHAYSVIGTAPFSDMAVMVVDGCGNCFADCIDLEGAIIPERPANDDLEQLYFEKDSYYEFRSGRLRPVYKDFSPRSRRQGYPMYPTTTMHSIGGAYLGASVYVFRGLDDPGKLMGLAPFGRPAAITDEMFSLRDGRVFLNYDWMTRYRQPARDAKSFEQDFQYYADIAYWVQREVERALLYQIQHRYALCPAEHLGYAGGVALNAVANGRIKAESPFKDTYVQPASADSGLAIGCAYFGWLEVLGQPRHRHSGRMDLGRRYDDAAVLAALTPEADRLTFRKDPDGVESAARLLLEHKVIGWFQGGAEFGPRALGARSILALPSRAETAAFINNHIKFREDFRPFAPSVLAEDASTYFELDEASPYMTFVVPVRPHWRAEMPAVVHRDGTARVQTVHQSLTPRFHALLEAVKRGAGHSVLLNTSLNMRSHPIVETPAEAVAMLGASALDALIIDDWVITKKSSGVIGGAHE